MFKNQKGFSLIELMVVVAIIGILSAVAVPQFQKFQRKAKQTEARAMLAGIYTAQKVFLTEAGSYYTNLWAIGFEPEGNLIYVTGFQTSSASNLPGYTAAPYTRNENRRTDMLCGGTYAAGVGQNCMHTASTSIALDAASTASSSAFLAHAKARSQILGGSAHDTWTMNHRKELVNTVNGAL